MKFALKQLSRCLSRSLSQCCLSVPSVLASNQTQLWNRFQSKPSRSRDLCPIYCSFAWNSSPRHKRADSQGDSEPDQLRGPVPGHQPSTRPTCPPDISVAQSRSESNLHWDLCQMWSYVVRSNLWASGDCGAVEEPPNPVILQLTFLVFAAKHFKWENNLNSVDAVDSVVGFECRFDVSFKAIDRFFHLLSDQSLGECLPLICSHIKVIILFSVFQWNRTTIESIVSIESIDF